MFPAEVVPEFMCERIGGDRAVLRDDVVSERVELRPHITTWRWLVEGASWSLHVGNATGPEGGEVLSDHADHIGADGIPKCGDARTSVHSKMGASLARTSSTMTAGTVSNLRAPRA